MTNPLTKDDVAQITHSAPFRFVLQRTEDTGLETLGEMSVADPGGSPVRICYTVELPWMNNRRNISCIPAGTYRVAREKNAIYGEIFRLHNVPDRFGILIHPANMASELRGCIAPGMQIERSPWRGVRYSRDALTALLFLAPKTDFQIDIVDVPASPSARTDSTPADSQ